jgi:23S rRNA-/tRNA-specific pseudouridylate synthase
MRLRTERLPSRGKEFFRSFQLSSTIAVGIMLLLLLAKPSAPFCRNVYQSHKGSCKRGISSFYRQQTFFRRHSSSSTTGAVDTAASQVNPTLDWKGSSLSTSEFANHVIIQADEAPAAVAEVVERVLSGRRKHQPLDPITKMSSEQLIGMGSVWYLPASAPRNPSLGEKPERLSAANATSLLLEAGDYLRVHHYPRRFLACANYDWSSYVDAINDSNKPGVIVAQDNEKGWIVVDKPAMVPVHMTVDNSQENVAACLQRARTPVFDSTNTTEEPPLPPYVTTPQRLDQNTSGLLVVASSKPFAAYFAKLLSTKTKTQLDGSNITSVDAIHKLYRCLVCLQPPGDYDGYAGPADDDDSPAWSVNQATAQLQSFVEEGTILRHYLEPSIRAPKRFVNEPPPDAEGNWAESLLKIRSAGNVYALVGNQAGRDLARALWYSPEARVEATGERIPTNCQGVVEVEIELLTGRTHQIRGQLSAMGFSLVGDAQYGGAIPANKTNIGSEQLALQCCELEFLDPDIVQKHDGTVSLNRSKRWNRFRLETAWWNPLLQQYQEQTNALGEGDATTAADDVPLPEPTSTTTIEDKRPLRSHLLPVRVSLSPGKHKYVLIKAEHPESDEVLWFCKSASPAECGGEYHGNVAQDLREWITAAGWKVTVTGGGRIDYRPDEKQAVVYGFSYGFGKGDHVRAANMIKEWSDGSIEATHDDSSGLY